jgi:hypothetical protein
MGHIHGELAMAVTGLSAAERCVLSRYAHRADDTGLCWPGLKSLTIETGVGRQWIVVCRQRLEQLGFLALVSKGGGRSSSVYRCNLGLIEERSTLDLSGSLKRPVWISQPVQPSETVTQPLSGSLRRPQQSSEATAGVVSGDPNPSLNPSVNPSEEKKETSAPADAVLFTTDDTLEGLVQDKHGRGVVEAIRSTGNADEETLRQMDTLFIGRSSSSIEPRHVWAALRDVQRFNGGAKAAVEGEAVSVVETSPDTTPLKSDGETPMNGQQVKLAGDEVWNELKEARIQGRAFSRPGAPIPRPKYSGMTRAEWEALKAEGRV